MDARTLDNAMNFNGMERDARKILIDEKLAKVEEVAVMTSVEVCEKILETYEIVSCEDEKITIVKKEDMKTYSNIVKFLIR